MIFITSIKKTSIILYGLMLLYTVPSHSFQESTNFASTVSSGKKALMGQNYDMALETFNQGHQSAIEMNDIKWQASFLFYMAVTKQQQAKHLIVKQDQKSILSEAADLYQKMLEIQPSSGSALNNLAQIYNQLGKMDEAGKSYELAIESDDSRKSFYAHNYADFLRENEKKSKAIQYYQIAVEGQPGDVEAQEELVKAYISAKSPRIFPHLWQSMKDGRILQAQEFVLDALLSKGWKKDEKIELLTILVFGLSKQFYDPQNFKASDTGKILKTIFGDQAISAGIEELFVLHDTAKHEPYDFNWWQKGKTWQEAPRGIWRFEAFRMLSKSIGKWYQQNKNPRLAKDYYLLSGVFRYDDLDPDAFLRCADLYIANDNLDDLKNMIEEYGSLLFEGKGAAYRDSDLLKIYKYHSALGVIYTNLKIWGNSRTPASAIFQLENARSIASRYNRSIENKKEVIQIEPRLINYLADGYNATNQPNKAFQLRLTAADEYLKMKNKKNAEQVLKDIEPPPGILEKDIKRYQKLIKTIQVKQLNLKEIKNNRP